MNSYPYIIKPRIIESLESEYPPIPEAPIISSQPIWTQKQPSKIPFMGLSISEFLVIIISGIIGIYTNNLTGLLTGIFLSSIVGFWGWFSYKTYPSKLQHYRKDKEKYQLALINWEKETEIKQEEYEQLKRKILAPENVNKWRQNQYFQQIKKINPSSDGSKNNQYQGYCECHFYSYLKRYFNDYIYQNIILQNPRFSDGYHYTVDFAYLDKEFNLWIDIEIDEPYTKRNGEIKPIHYLGLRKQEERDNYFQSRDWFVIRFTEEQIAKYPDNCCRSIADLISQIKGINSFPKELQNINPVTDFERWTYDKAWEMGRNNYRDTYTHLC